MKGVHERIWQPSHVKLASDICGNNEVSVMSRAAHSLIAGLPQ
jgi:hypothetical protein